MTGLDNNIEVRLIYLDTKRLKDLEKIDQSSLIGGRTVSEIIKRFNKKIKDPRDDFKGKRNVFSCSRRYCCWYWY